MVDDLSSFAGKMDENQWNEEVKSRSENLKVLLMPMESCLMQLQSLLVWEKPRNSAVMLLCVNVIFWFSTTYRVLYIIPMTALVVVVADMFRNRIWPEIRVERAEEDEEGWVSLHPNLLTVPELCDRLAEFWLNSIYSWNFFWEMRTNLPGKFCLYVCSISLALALVGHYIHGIHLAYIIVTSLLLWPSMVYHKINLAIYRKLEPLWMQLQYSTRHTQQAQKRRRRRRQESVSTEEGFSEGSDRLDDFLPNQDEAEAALALAVTDPDSNSDLSDEETAALLGKLAGRGKMSRDSSLGGSSPGKFSRESSTGNILAQANDDGGNVTDNEDSFLAGLPHQIPAQHDFDHSMSFEEQQLLPSQRRPHPSAAADPMTFVSSHFSQQPGMVEEEEDTFARGLRFPEMEASRGSSDLLDSVGTETDEGPSLEGNVATATGESVAEALESALRGLDSPPPTPRQTEGGRKLRISSENSDSDFEMLDKPETTETAQQPSGVADHGNRGSPYSGYLNWVSDKVGSVWNRSKKH